MTACKGAVDFRLTGPGVGIATSLDDGDGDSDFLYVTFVPNSTYTAVDNHQPTVAHATFSTTAASLSSSTPTSTSTNVSTSSSAGQSSGESGPSSTLVGGVSATGKVTLTLDGKAVTTLRPGLYVITVNDRSAKAGFFVKSQAKAARPVTTISFKGRQSASLKLTKGQWSFSPSAAGKKTAFVVASGQ